MSAGLPLEVHRVLYPGPLAVFAAPFSSEREGPEGEVSLPLLVQLKSPSCWNSLSSHGFPLLDTSTLLFLLDLSIWAINLILYWHTNKNCECILYSVCPLEIAGWLET